MDRSKQRMTFSLPKDLVQRLKVFAEKRGKPMSGLILRSSRTPWACTTWTVPGKQERSEEEDEREEKG